jgi:succinate dehydrogenase / fumarate reductase flavoprotein subunit
VHGANRLGGNSLSINVPPRGGSAHRGSHAAGRFVSSGEDLDLESARPVESMNESKGGESVAALKKALQTVMNSFGVFRTEGTHAQRHQDADSCADVRAAHLSDKSHVQYRADGGTGARQFTGSGRSDCDCSRSSP